MRRFLASAVAVVLSVSLWTVLTATQPGGADPNPALASDAHGHMANGKALPHVSGGTEVSFNDERAIGADATNGSSDAPPDGTAGALGCANRGSATNVRANQDCTARRQAEEQVTVNPADPTNIIAGQNDSRVGFNHCGFDYSLNGGTTFGDGQPGFFQHLNPGTNHTYDAASDPAVTVDGTGTAWYSCVMFDVATNATGIFAVPSTPALKGSAYANIGAGPSKYVVAEADDGHVFFDKEFIAADPRPGHHEVYETFTRFISDQKCATGNNPGAYCSSEIWYSKWNGSVWSAPVNLSGASSDLCVGGNTFDHKAAANACNFDQGSMPVVMADGSVFVVWNNGNTPTLVNQTLGRKINPNGSLGDVVKVGKDDESNLALCDLGRGPEECVSQLKVRTNDYPAISVDPTNNSHLVAVWQDTRQSGANAGNYGVVVSESANGGATWTDRDGTGTYLFAGTSNPEFEPSVTVAGNGHVAVSYYKAAGATDGTGTYGYGLQSRSTGTFSSYTSVSDSQILPSPETSLTQKGFLGDYSSIAASTASGSSTVYACWSDTRNSSAAGPDEDVFVRAMDI